jgi:hypothetical protein
MKAKEYYREKLLLEDFKDWLIIDFGKNTVFEKLD